MLVKKNGRGSPRVAPARVAVVASAGVASRSRRTSAVFPATTRRMNGRSSSGIRDLSLLERLLRLHRLPSGGDARRRHPGSRAVRRVAFALLLECPGVEVPEEPRALDERHELHGPVWGGRVLG